MFTIYFKIFCYRKILNKKKSFIFILENIIFLGFDDYYLNLRPRVDNECDGQSENNVPHKELPGKIVNCRNIWFREFWSQHHKCSFNANLSAGMTRCTGTEELIDYEQEGLVPFVGNKYFYYFRSQKLNFLFFLKNIKQIYNSNRRKGIIKLGL